MWEQGEHVAIVGDTGSGKTYLESVMLEIPRWNIILKTKDDDIRFPGFRRVRRTESIEVPPSASGADFILEPSYAAQATEGRKVIEKVWADGGWTFTVDELWYAENKLRLTDHIDRLLTQGRSVGISVVCGMQRPSRVSRFALSQCTHLFAFQTEGRDTLTLAEAFTPKLKLIIPELRRYEFVYMNRKTRILRRGYAQQLAEVLA